MFCPILEKPPYDIRVEVGDDGCASVIVTVAKSLDGNRIVSMVCELVDAPEISAGCWEFSFSVDVFALDGSIPAFRTQSRDDAAAFIPAEIRHSVMDVVCAGLWALLDHVEPPMVYWVTKDCDLPEKALRKYYLLKETCEKLGYLPHHEGTDPFGRRFWAMRRDTD